MIQRPPRSPLFPSPPLFRSERESFAHDQPTRRRVLAGLGAAIPIAAATIAVPPPADPVIVLRARAAAWISTIDRKSTRLNSSHANISYAVFCLKKKNTSLSL